MGGKKRLGVLGLALITYFNVAGGPWGSEPIISSCGPLIGILSAIIFPFVWCLPLALSFAELFSAYPTDSSFCTWVGKAYGRPMGFHIGYWAWVGGVIDNAIYPCLMVDSIVAALLGPEYTLKTVIVPLWMYLIRLTACTLFMLPTLRSIDVVGRFLAVLGFLMIMPFFVLVYTSIPQINVDNWFIVKPEGREYRELLSVLYWSYTGFDAAGAYASEIGNPRYTFPRAMVLTVIMIALTYSVPFVAVAGVNKPPYETWKDGFYPLIAEKISGPFLRSWFLFCTVLGNMGTYVAKLTKNGFMLAGMADLGLAPSYFVGRSAETGVPTRSILLGYGIVSFMALFDFNVILGVDNFLSAIACVTELSAVVRLRFILPDLERPYKINLSDKALVAVMATPFIIGSFVAINEFTKSGLGMLLNIIALAGGEVYHRLLRNSQRRQMSPRASKMFGDGFKLPLETSVGGTTVSPRHPLLVDPESGDDSKAARVTYT